MHQLKKPILLLLVAFSSTCGFADTLLDSPELASLQDEFPVLAKLLAAESPWEQAPAQLANAIFNRPPRIVQGSSA